MLQTKRANGRQCSICSKRQAVGVTASRCVSSSLLTATASSWHLSGDACMREKLFFGIDTLKLSTSEETKASLKTLEDPFIPIANHY